MCFDSQAWCRASALSLAVRRVSYRHFCVYVTLRSSQLLEANLDGLLSEASSAEHEFVLSDETLLVGAHAAGAGVLAVLSGVGVLLVGHLRRVSVS